MLILIIVLFFSKTENYLFLLSLYKDTAENNQTLSKALGKGFERSVYQNEYKIKSENNITMNQYIYFLESNFVRDKELLHELFLTTGQKTKTRNVFFNNMSTDTNLTKA